MKFTLNPHVLSILCGRGMCKDGRLLCVARNCLYHPEDSPDPDFGREIKVKGYAICSRCGVTTEYEEGAEWSDNKQKTIMKCKACNKIIPRKTIVWTQEVVSKHRRTRHKYFHIECYDAMFVDVPDGNDEAFWSGFGFVDMPDKEFAVLIKKAERYGRV